MFRFFVLNFGVVLGVGVVGLGIVVGGVVLVVVLVGV